MESSNPEPLSTTACSTPADPAQATAMPKLRLTLRMGSSSEPSTAPASEPASTKKKKTPSSAGVSKPKQSRPFKGTTTGSKGNPSNLSIEPTASSQGQSNNNNKPPEKKEMHAQFDEQIQQLRDMRAFKTRKWTSAQCTIKTLSGTTLTLPIWAREGTFSHEEDGFEPRSRRNSTDGKLRLTLPNSKGAVLACTEAGCNRSFDAKDKLKRHLTSHKKKAAAGKLQFKLPNLKLVQKQDGDPATEDDAMEVTQDFSELPHSEATMDQSHSVLDSQI